MKQKKNTDSVIDQLCEDLGPVNPRCPYRAIAIWFGLSALYLVGVVSYFGPKMDLIGSLNNAAFLFEMSMAILLFIFSVIAASFLSFPDEAQKGWIKIVALTLFGAFMLWIIANIVEERAALSFFTLGSCYKGLVIEAIPFIALIYLTMRGHSTQPYWLMTMNVFAVSALGWMALRVTCSMYDSMVYGFLHYLLPFAVLGVTIGFFARKIFKW